MKKAFGAWLLFICVLAVFLAGALFINHSRQHIVTKYCDIFYSGDFFDRRVSPEDAGMVANVADGDWAAVCAAFSIDPKSFRPRVEIAGDTVALKGEAGTIGAVGAYYDKTIYVATPGKWRADALTHEMTHLAVDIKTRGNYSRWFTEGVALYYESRISGEEWRPDLKNPGVSYEALQNRFDELDPSIAYRAAYEAVAAFVDSGGEEALQSVMEYLGGGADKRVVLELSFGDY